MYFKLWLENKMIQLSKPISSLKNENDIELNEMPIGQTKRNIEFYHGTDSDQFQEFNPQKAAKSKQYYNPLGSGLYVTDQKYFASVFGKNIYKVVIPPGYKYKRYSRKEWITTGEDIILTALYEAQNFYEVQKLKKKFPNKNVWKFKLPVQFRIEIARSLNNYSPYEALYESLLIVDYFFPFDSEQFANILPKISDRKFRKYDFVIFMNTNDAMGYVTKSGKIKSAQEIVIFNPILQKTVKES